MSANAPARRRRRAPRPCRRAAPSWQRPARRGAVAALLLGAALASGVRAQESDGELGRSIRARIEALRAAGHGTAGAGRLLATTALSVFYERRGFEPAWVGGQRGTRRLEALLAAADSAARHGLDPEDYDRDRIAELTERARTGRAATADLVDLELLASDAFMVLGSHLLHGRVDPESVNPEWIANRRSSVMEDVLERALAEDRVRETLEDLAPRQPRYERMLEAADRLRARVAAGGWGRVGPGPALRTGDEGPRVEALRRRLTATGDLGSRPAAPPPDALTPALDGRTFDEEVRDAVRRFQGRNGLEVDGVVGAATIRALDVPAEERLRQIEVNLERWRWLPDDLGARHIEVNIAGFSATVVEEGKVARAHRVVVGRRYRQTPTFSGLVSYLVFAPYWHVPPNIAELDKLPQIRSDPGVVTREHMTLIDVATNRPVDPLTIDWSDTSGGEFNRLYRLRQDPGPWNALGAVKFMFPNPHHVYLHDTPSRELFDRTSRSFSSGCIRVEHALDLAEYLLADQPEWTRSRIDSVAGAGVERAVQLRERVPVHLLYWTAWADADGVMHFRDDLYGRDAAVRRALEAPPPGP